MAEETMLQGGCEPAPRRVLALDTSTDVRVGVAVAGQVVARAAVTDTRQHVERLTGLLDQVLREADLRVADLDLVCVGLGPGPFTGLRVGVVAAQVLAGVRDLPLHGVCSLDVIAAGHAGEDGAGDFLVVTDAARREVYWSRHDAAGVRVEGPNVSAPAALAEQPYAALPVVGPGAHLVDPRRARPLALDAGLLAARNLGIPAAGADPLYLRRPDATEPGRRKSALPTSRPRLRRDRLPHGQGGPR